jgi:predicted AAA+ superfamily ATPase
MKVIALNGSPRKNGLPAWKMTNRITYWREGGYEVDYVVARGRDVWAIEVKSGRSSKASSLTRFRDRYPEARALLVGGQGIPLETFFNRDAASWLV